MAIDPLEYDVEELREMVGRGDGGFDRTYGEGGFLWPVVPEKLEEPDAERVNAWEQVVSGHASKPFLTAVPTGEEAEEAVFGWLGFLQSRVGFEGCLDALEYYRSVGWITEDVENDLQGYLLGVGREPGDGDGLDRRDHMRSLMFIARLSSLQEPFSGSENAQRG